MRRPLLTRSVLLIAFLPGGCDKPLPERPRPVLTVAVEPYTDEVVARFAGSIQPRYETVLGFRVGGRIVQRLAGVGERVEKGAVLAELDPGEWRNLLMVRSGELAEARARYGNAQAEERRQQQLYFAGVGSKAQLEQVRTRLKVLGAGLEQARSAEQQAREQLSHSRLYSDDEGVVTAWYVDVGQVVVPGQSVVSLARPRAREAVFDVPMGLVEKLSDVRFQVRAELEPNVVVGGKIRELAPQADLLTRSRRVRLSLDRTPASFHLGSTVQVMLSRSVSSRTRLPRSALLERLGNSLVWVVVAGRTTLREVRVVARDDVSIIVDHGLQPGEQVVVAGVNNLYEGQSVIIDERAR